jgi:hypothetical protein
MHRVPQLLYEDFALFKPKTYIAGRQMHSEDFHVIIPSAPPPDTMSRKAGALYKQENHRL